MNLTKDVLLTLNRIKAIACSRLRTDRAWNKPTNAIFEMSSRCILKCPLCNTGGLSDRFPHVRRGDMSFETFRAGLDKLLPELGQVLLYNWGEPFLNKDLFRCIEYAHRHDVRTQMSSNMMLYTEGNGLKLLDSGLTKLIVSADGLTQESYGRYRKGGDLSKVVAAVENMVRLKRERGTGFPLIEMQFIVFRHNEREMDAYRRSWLTKGVDAVNFIRMSYMSKEGRKVADDMELAPVHPDYQPHHPYGKMNRCSELYYHVSIDYNGDWYTCCFPSGDPAYRVGNIVRDDFWSVWNGTDYRYFRRLLRTRRTVCGHRETMCHDCVGIFPENAARRYWA